MMGGVRLTQEERDLLTWLGESEYSQYGECYGQTFDRLYSRGWVTIHGPGEHQEGFIAKEPPPAERNEQARMRGVMMYRAVSLTEAGREVLASLKETPR